MIILPRSFRMRYVLCDVSFAATSFMQFRSQRVSSSFQSIHLQHTHTANNNNKKPPNDSNHLLCVLIVLPCSAQHLRTTASVRFYLCHVFMYTSTRSRQYATTNNMCACGFVVQPLLHWNIRMQRAACALEREREMLVEIRAGHTCESHITEPTEGTTTISVYRNTRITSRIHVGRQTLCQTCTLTSVLYLYIELHGTYVRIYSLRYSHRAYSICMLQCSRYANIRIA